MKLDLVLQRLEVLEFKSYYPVGPAEQLPGFGWGLGSWGGEAQTHKQQL